MKMLKIDDYYIILKYIDYICYFYILIILYLMENHQKNPLTLPPHPPHGLGPGWDPGPAGPLGCPLSYKAFIRNNVFISGTIIQRTPKWPGRVPGRALPGPFLYSVLGIKKLSQQGTLTVIE